MLVCVCLVLVFVCPFIAWCVCFVVLYVRCCIFEET